jgi:hypothetical protein
MTIHVSTKFKEDILGPHSFASIFNGGRIKVFSGPQPATADHPETGAYLGEVSVEGNPWVVGGENGLNFVLDGPWATNDPAQAWRLVASVAGTAGWFRLVGRLGDTGGYSFAAPRIDGSVGAIDGADFRVPTTALTVGYSAPVQQFLFTLPPVFGA